MIEDKETKDYVLIEKEGKLAITIPESFCEGFDFSLCDVELDGMELLFEPTDYSSSFDFKVILTKGEHADIIEKYDSITVAQVDSSGKFGEIYEIEIS